MTNNEMRGNISSEPLWEVTSAQRPCEMSHLLSSTRQLAHLLTRGSVSCNISRRPIVHVLCPLKRVRERNVRLNLSLALGKDQSISIPANLDWWSELNSMPPDRTQTSSSLHHPPWVSLNHNYSLAPRQRVICHGRPLLGVGSRQHSS